MFKGDTNKLKKVIKKILPTTKLSHETCGCMLLQLTYFYSIKNICKNTAFKIQTQAVMLSVRRIAPGLRHKVKTNLS